LIIDTNHIGEQSMTHSLTNRFTAMILSAALVLLSWTPTVSTSPVAATGFALHTLA
jgi:hypothetical protein